MSARLALYLAPEPDEPLWKFGSGWLGYDAESGESCRQPLLTGVDAAELREATAHPRLYGFHMTLKAPFRLAEGASIEAFEEAIMALAARHAFGSAIDLALEAREAGSGQVFLCLAPARRDTALHRLEADAVLALDPFRAALSPAEIARRKPERLNARERSYLDAHGYPYVLEAFRPHFSLTGPIEPDSLLVGALRQQLEAAPGLCSFRPNSLVLFEQPDHGARFRVLKRFPLAKSG